MGRLWAEGNIDCCSGQGIKNPPPNDDLGIEWWIERVPFRSPYGGNCGLGFGRKGSFAQLKGRLNATQKQSNPFWRGVTKTRTRRSVTFASCVTGGVATHCRLGGFRQRTEKNLLLRKAEQHWSRGTMGSASLEAPRSGSHKGTANPIYCHCGFLKGWYCNQSYMKTAFKSKPEQTRIF